MKINRRQLLTRFSAFILAVPVIGMFTRRVHATETTIRLQHKAIKTEPMCVDDIRFNTHESLIAISTNIRGAVQCLLDECKRDGRTPESISIDWINRTNLDPSDPDYNPHGYLGHFLVTGRGWRVAPYLNPDSDGNVRLLQK